MIVDMFDPPHSRTETSTPEDVSVLRVENLGKTFPGQVAFAGLNMDVAPGEIHALVGANGSGKSTFIKCLAGVHQADPGSRVHVGLDRLPDRYPPSEARSFGLAFVHQDLGLLANLSLMENLAMGRGYATRWGWRIDWKRERARCRSLLNEHGIDAAPHTLVGDLTIVEQTLFAIARGIEDVSDGGRLIVLDEPTAALPDTDVGRLFDAVRRVADTGIGVIYVSHRLDEVFALSQRVTVLRDGVCQGTYATDSIDHDGLVEVIAGRSVDVVDTRTHRDQVSLDAARVVETRDLSGNQIRHLSMTVRSGEIVGVAGLAGSGRSELARLLFGSQEREGGSVYINGRSANLDSPADAIRLGVAMVPQDRRGDGCFLGLSAGRNMTLPSVGSLYQNGRIRAGKEKLLQQDLVRQFRVQPADAERPMYAFSGGNQQKVVLAKWMHREPRFLIFDEPVQGIDVGAKADVHKHILAAADAGAAVLLIDSEFENLSRLCDRILILQNGEIVDELVGDDRTSDTILRRIFASQPANGAIS
jgi:ABC-type sugar transport system ATPase subunit